MLRERKPNLLNAAAVPKYTSNNAAQSYTARADMRMVVVYLVQRCWRQQNTDWFTSPLPNSWKRFVRLIIALLWGVRQLYALVKNRNTRWKQNLYLHSREYRLLGSEYPRGCWSVASRRVGGVGKEKKKKTHKWAKKCENYQRQGQCGKSKQSYQQCERKAHKSSVGQRVVNKKVANEITHENKPMGGINNIMRWASWWVWLWLTLSLRLGGHILE